MMNKNFLLLLSYFAISHAVSQSVGIGTNNPAASARLDVSSTSQGFLPPRMTYAQRNAVSNAVAGLVIYCSDCGSKGQLQVFNGASWTDAVGNAPLPPPANLPSVTICNMVWTNANLSTAFYRNGDPIPQVQPDANWNSLTSGAWCWYNNDSLNYSQYGRIYNWYAVNDPRGLAPVGWHVATVSEWNKMVICIDPTADTINAGLQSSTAGGSLKQTGTTLWSTPNTGATNSVGFAALGAGMRDYTSTFKYNLFYGFFWTSNGYNNNTTAYSRDVYYAAAGIETGLYDARNGFSVRLVKDQ